MAQVPAGWTRTKRPDWHTATYRRDALCTECVRTEGETVAIEVWYDVYSKHWLVQPVDSNHWDTQSTSYVLDRADAFAEGNMLARCGRNHA